MANATNLTLDCQSEDDRRLMPYCEMLTCKMDRVPNTEYIGVALQVISVSISASCLLVMKLSTDYEQGLPLCPCRRGSCHKKGWKWRFVVGWAANTASEAFISTLAFYFAPLSVLAPITGVGILVTALLAGTGYVPCFGFPPGFKEHISPAEKLGLGVLLAGMVATSWFGPSSEFTDSYQSWQAEWSRPEVLVQLAVTFSLLGGWTAMLLLPCLRRMRPHGKSVPLALGSSLGAAAAGAYSQLFAKMTVTAIVRMLIYDEVDEVRPAASAAAAPRPAARPPSSGIVGKRRAPSLGGPWAPKRHSGPVRRPSCRRPLSTPRRAPPPLPRRRRRGR